MYVAGVFVAGMFVTGVYVTGMLALFAFAPVGAAPVPHAKVELLSESSKIAPGEEATLGVRFTIDDGWRISWRNPGKSGAAPSVVWDAPKEITIGEMQWPAPDRIGSGRETSYGYQHSVLLLVPARVAAGKATTAGSTVTIRAVVDFWVCKEACEKAQTTATLTLPAGTGGSAAAHFTDFSRARANVPQPFPPTWTVRATSEKHEWVLTVDMGRRERAATFFPYQPAVIDDGGVQIVESRGKGLALHIRKPALSLYGPDGPSGKAPASLDGVLVVPRSGIFEVRALLDGRLDFD